MKLGRLSVYRVLALLHHVSGYIPRSVDLELALPIPVNDTQLDHPDG